MILKPDERTRPRETYWESIARTRWGAYITEVEKRVILMGHELLIKPTSAIEVGCEGGRWSQLLSNLGWNMTCSDVNLESLNICQERIPNATCIHVDPTDNKLPCSSESMRLMLCIEVAPVIHAEWFIDESSRVLQNNGLLIGVCLNSYSLRGYFASRKALLSGNYNSYTTEYSSWRKKLVNNGFSVQYEEGFCWFPFRRRSDSVLVPYFVWLEKVLSLRNWITVSPWIIFIARKQP